MKRLLFVLVLAILMFITAAGASAKPPEGTGFDVWGYNYQAHIFNGMFCDAYFNAPECQPFRDVHLLLKWNDAYLSNQDRDGDGQLDIHWGYPSYIGSGAWVSNLQRGTYLGADGTEQRWEYFVRVVAKQTADTVCDEVWDDFCIVQEVSNGLPLSIRSLRFNIARPQLGKE